VFPAALDLERQDLVVSHPGLTYGGVMHDGALRGTVMLEALQAIVCAYRKMGLGYLQYKAVPHIYHKVPASDDLYALFRLGAERYRCDLSTTIDLAYPRRMNRLRRRELRKAKEAGLRIIPGPHCLESFWPVLEENRKSKFGVRPVHTLEEIELLRELFPEEIKCMIGTVEGKVVGGLLLFRANMVVHAQYGAATDLGSEIGASTALMDCAIWSSDEQGARYFDFGTSNEDEGKVLNNGLHKFKASFGAGSVVHEFYELELR
jgi:hypothetical protein